MLTVGFRALVSRKCSKIQNPKLEVSKSSEVVSTHTYTCELAIIPAKCRGVFICALLRKDDPHLFVRVKFCKKMTSKCGFCSFGNVDLPNLGNYPGFHEMYR